MLQPSPSSANAARPEGALTSSEATRAIPPGDDEGAFIEFLSGLGPRSFAAYQPSSLLRQIRRRMARIGIDDLAAYRARLAGDRAEYRALCDALSVHETAFFRDPGCWRHIAEEVLPRLIERARGAPLRLWCAGCATGEEAYTLAMLVAEALAPGGRLRDAHERTLGRRAIDDGAARRPFTLFATDVSERVVERASRGRYAAERVEAIPADLRERYLERREDGHAVVSPALRACMVFARHDLLSSFALGQMDLIACRNTLMYFTTAAQGRVLAGLAEALRRDGILLVGSAEYPAAWSDRFTPDSLPHRTFATVARPRGMIWRPVREDQVRAIERRCAERLG